MMIARSLYLQGLGFMQGWHYEDSDTNESREIDILSTSYAYGKNILPIQAIIECKYSEQPLLAFTYKGLSKSPVDFWVPCNVLGRNTLNKIIQERLINEIPVFSQQNTIAYTLKQVYQDEEVKKKDRRDAAFEAIMSVVNASYSLSKLYTEKLTTLPSIDGTELKPSVFIGMPTVVVRAPLFICYLDDKNRIALEPQSSLLLEWSYPKVGLMMIRVIQEEKIVNFGKDIAHSIEMFNDELKDDF